MTIKQLKLKKQQQYTITKPIKNKNKNKKQKCVIFLNKYTVNITNIN